MNVGVLVLMRTSAHGCRSTGTRVGVLVLRSTGTHELGSTGTFYLFLTYVEVDLYLGVADVNPILKEIPSSHF
jgi:hypothetical protein